MTKEELQLIKNCPDGTRISIKNVSFIKKRDGIRPVYLGTKTKFIDFFVLEKIVG